MLRSLRKKFVAIGVALSLLLFYSPHFLHSRDSAKGNIIGFVYAEDGTTPIEGAVVKVKNISTDVIYESSKSDRYGVFKIKGVESGVYICGVVTPEGDFNSEGLVGVRIRNNETAKMSISLVPYEQQVAEPIHKFYHEQSITWEALVGRVVNYNPYEKLAEVFVTKGMLQVNDEIHLKGEVTDFYQDLKIIKLNGSSVKRLLAGQTGFLGVIKPVEKEDLVYLVCKRRRLPLFLVPIGIAAIIAGSCAIYHGIVILDGNGDEVSPFKR